MKPCPRSLLWFLLLSLGLSAVFLAQTRVAQRHWSVTIDETYYLNCALQSVKERWIDPRLSQSGVGPLPILLTTIPAAWTVPPSDRPQEWMGGRDHPSINLIARRWNSALIGVPLVLFTSGWLWRRRGLGAAALGGVLMAFSPTILAHASLATTDAASALFSLISVAVLTKWHVEPRRSTFLFGAVSIGLAISAKYSGVFLLPVAGILLVLQIWPNTTGRLPRRFWVTMLRSGARLGLLSLIAMTVCWATDGFSFSGPLKTVSLEDTPSDSPWIKLLGNGPLARRIMDRAHREWKRPSIVAALIARWLHNATGHPAYWKGQHSTMGWPWYFPCAWIWKSTLSEFVLSLSILPLLWMSYRMEVRDDSERTRTRLVWIVAIVMFWLMVVSAHVNIGQRYLMPLYPLIILLAVDLLWMVLRNRPRWLLGIGLTLGIVQVQSALAIAPHYLAYFSPLIGGAENGRHYLVDSNLDWGQDLPSLRRELEDRGYRRALLEYFGNAKPEAYDLNVSPFSEVGLEDLDQFDVFAVSVTKLQGDYLFPMDPFEGFRDREPSARAGYSLFLYDLSDETNRSLLRDAWHRYSVLTREPPQE